ncbi:hypothetical protein K469DRAFT_744622 [Zopfia rhizophila CBS 207.26]|uniref:Uncharacterized protein n=1 Tax=Zopfia rhizophila CBS 207.26 TaxID=1314779 RepID=A0A6A6EV11_9PEZI|nr:hypothetical protein K469DRAFT_744622 [Zopfia rhizophila CBS 207.26]
MNVDDVYLVVHYYSVPDTLVFLNEQQRLQVALLILLPAYTATRPAALVYKSIDRRRLKEHYISWEDGSGSDTDIANEMDLDLEEIKTLCYEDVILLMLPNPKGKHDIIVMEVTWKYTKGAKKKLRSLPTTPNKTFILTEVDDFLFDSILLMIIIAILDNAFNFKVTLVKNIYCTWVHAPRSRIEFKWRQVAI